MKPHLFGFLLVNLLQTSRMAHVQFKRHRLASCRWAVPALCSAVQAGNCLPYETLTRHRWVHHEANWFAHSDSGPWWRLDTWMLTSTSRPSLRKGCLAGKEQEPWELASLRVCFFRPPGYCLSMEGSPLVLRVIPFCSSFLAFLNRVDYTLTNSSFLVKS